VPLLHIHMWDIASFLWNRRSLWRIGSGVLAGAVGVYFAGRARMMRAVDRQYRVPLLFLPPIFPSKATLSLLGALASREKMPPLPADVAVTESKVSIQGAASVKVFAIERKERTSGGPAILWIHGGGYVLGSTAQDAPLMAKIAQETDALVIGVEYRLAPQHPFPAPLDDCYTGLKWLHENADRLRVNPDRIAIGGRSAGGGLCAALAQRAHDEAGVKPVFQALLYPMLDDRTTLKAAPEGRGYFLWNPGQNLLGWTAYLGHVPGAKETFPYAAPARREDLAGLPPAWLGVGTLDLFYDEDLAYVNRLRAAGVACELDVVDKAYHGFDVVSRNAPGKTAFENHMISAIKRALA
jgi:acetyl esterase/lipase